MSSEVRFWPQAEVPECVNFTAGMLFQKGRFRPIADIRAWWFVRPTYTHESGSINLNSMTASCSGNLPIRS